MVFEINNKQNISQVAQTASSGGVTSSSANNTPKTIFDSQTNTAQLSNGTQTVPDSNEIKNGTKDFDELVDKLKIPETDTKLDPSKIKSIHTDENNNIVVKYTSDDGSEVQYTFSQKPDSAVKTESGQKPSAEYKPVEKRTTKEGIEEITKYNDDNSKVVTKGARSTTFDSNNRITNVKTDKSFGISTETSYEYSGNSNVPTKQIITGVNGQKTEITQNIKNPNEKKDEKPVPDTNIQNDNNKKDSAEQHLYPKPNENFQQTAERLGLKEGTKEYEAFKKANPDALAENQFPQGQKINIPDELKDKIKVDDGKTEQSKPNESTDSSKKSDSKDANKPAEHSEKVASDKTVSEKPEQPSEKEHTVSQKPSQTEASQSAVTSDAATEKPAQTKSSQVPQQANQSEAEHTQTEVSQPVLFSEPKTEPAQLQKSQTAPQLSSFAQEPAISEIPQPAPASAEDKPVLKLEGQDNIQNVLPQDNEPVKQPEYNSEVSPNFNANDSEVDFAGNSGQESVSEKTNNQTLNSTHSLPDSVIKKPADAVENKSEQEQTPDTANIAAANQPVKTENDVQQEIQTNPLANNNNPQPATQILNSDSSPVSDFKAKVSTNFADSPVSPDKTAVQSGQAAQVHVSQRTNNTTPQSQTSRSDTTRKLLKPASQSVDADNSFIDDIEGLNPNSAVPRVESVAEVRSGYVGQKADNKSSVKTESDTASVQKSSSLNVKPDTIQAASVTENNVSARKIEQQPLSDKSENIQNNDTKKEEKIIQHKKAESEAVQQFENLVTEDIQNKTVTQSKSALTQNQRDSRIAVNIAQTTKGVVGSVQTVNPPNNSSNTGSDSGSGNGNGSNHGSKNTTSEQKNSEAEDV